jgi:hypothetical protein
VALVSRGLWFAVGVASGVYGVFKVRRAVDAVTPDGVRARVASLRKGARVFADEVAAAARAREAELLSELRAGARDDRMLPEAEPPAIPGPRAAALEPPSAVDHPARTPARPKRESVTDGHR